MRAAEAGTLDTHDKNLSVLLGANRFFFYISDVYKRILWQEHFALDPQHTTPAAAFQSILDTAPILSQAYRQVHFLHDTPQYTLVPHTVFDPAITRQYLSSVCTLRTDTPIHTNPVEEQHLHVVFGLRPSWQPLLLQRFPMAQHYHIATALLRRTSRLTQPQEVFVNVQTTHLHIMVYRDGALQLFNTFKYSSAEAFLYYVLLMYQTFGLSAKDTPLTLLGSIMPNSLVYRLVSTYIRQIKFAKRTKYYQFSPLYSDVPQQFYYDLYSLSVCE